MRIPPVTHGKNSNKNYERNIYIIKIIIPAVLLCGEQGMVLKGHREQDSSNDIRKNSDTERTMQKGNFKCVCNI